MRLERSNNFAHNVNLLRARETITGVGMKARRVLCQPKHIVSLPIFAVVMGSMAPYSTPGDPQNNILQGFPSGCVRREIPGGSQVDEKGHKGNTAVVTAYFC